MFNYWYSAKHFSRNSIPTHVYYWFPSSPINIGFDVDFSVGAVKNNAKDPISSNI